MSILIRYYTKQLQKKELIVYLYKSKMEKLNQSIKKKNRIENQ